MHGFFNKSLKINLTNKAFQEEFIPDRVYEKYLGGKGLGTYLLLKENPARVDGTKAFGKILIDLARRDDRIVFVGADSSKVAYDFRELFPDRFYDLGVAEQNACSFSAGLAFAGKKPFFSAIANFGTIRCLEQIRNDI